MGTINSVTGNVEPGTILRFILSGTDSEGTTETFLSGLTREYTADSNGDFATGTDEDTGLWANQAGTVGGTYWTVVEMKADGKPKGERGKISIPAASATYSFATLLGQNLPAGNSPVTVVYSSEVSTWTAGVLAGKFPNGTAALPSITFASDTNTGLFRHGNDAVGVTTAGTEAIRFTNSEVRVSTNLRGPIIYVDPDTGLDTNEGTSTAPFATFARAMRACASGVRNIIYLLADKTYTTAPAGGGTEDGATKYFDPNTTVLIYKSGSGADPILNVTPVLKSGSYEIGYRISYYVELSVVFKEIDIRCPAKGGAESINNIRDSIFAPAAFSGFPPINLSFIDCDLTTEAGGLYLADAVNAAVTVDVSNVTLNLPQRLINGGAGGSIRLTGSSVTDSTSGVTAILYRAPTGFASLVATSLSGYVQTA